MKIDKTQLKEILLNELKFSNTEADIYLRDYPDEIHTQLDNVFSLWLKDRQVSNDPIYENLTVPMVMKGQGGGNFLESLRYINRLCDNDLSPDEKTKMISRLTRPFIRW